MIDFVDSEAARLADGRLEIDRSDDSVFALARPLQGLTLDEARHAIRRAVTVSGRLGAESVPLLLEEKKQIVNRSGLVQYIADGTRIEHGSNPLNPLATPVPALPIQDVGAGAPGHS